jgi:hypothetical protein
LLVDGGHLNHNETPASAHIGPSKTSHRTHREPKAKVSSRTRRALGQFFDKIDGHDGADAGALFTQGKNFPLEHANDLSLIVEYRLSGVADRRDKYLGRVIQNDDRRDRALLKDMVTLNKRVSGEEFALADRGKPSFELCFVVVRRQRRIASSAASLVSRPEED